MEKASIFERFMNFVNKHYTAIAIILAVLIVIVSIITCFAYVIIGNYKDKAERAYGYYDMPEIVVEY